MDASDRRARARAEAAEWWVRIEGGELSREERGEFVDWMRESAVHVAELLRMAEVHGALEQFSNWAGIPTDGPETAPNVVPFGPVSVEAERASLAIAGDPPSTTRRASSGRGWKVGIALAAAVAVIGFFVAPQFGSKLIETGRGERRSVTLADGSVLQIDPESRLRVRLEKHERNVYLEHGRAMFRVAKDHERPFLVHAEATLVRAVGTQFGVEDTREGIVVTVAEGKVAVVPRELSAGPFSAGSRASQGAGSQSASPGRGATARPQSAAGTGNSRAAAEVMLSAGQQVIVHRRGPTEPVRAVDTSRELAWASGRLVFENESVADVIDEFNRYNVVQLHVANPELAHRSVSGVFDASEPESFIGFMQSVAPVNVSRAGQDITIALAP